MNTAVAAIVILFADTFPGISVVGVVVISRLWCCYFAVGRKMKLLKLVGSVFGVRPWLLLLLSLLFLFHPWLMAKGLN